MSGLSVSSNGSRRSRRQRHNAPSEVASMQGDMMSQEGGVPSRVIVQGTQEAVGYTDPFRLRVAPQGWDDDSIVGASTLADGETAFPGEGADAAGVPQQGAQWDALFSTDDALMFWGADVKITDYKRLAEGFLETWVPQNREMATAGGSYYFQQMQKMFLSERTELEVDMTYMREYNQQLFENTVDFPLEALPVLTEQVNASYSKSVRLLEEHSADIPELTVRVSNMPQSKAMRELRPDDIGKIVSVRGMVVRVTKVLPEMRTAMFECRDCFHKEYEPEQRGRIEEPAVCPNCGNRQIPFVLKHNQCEFVDKQFIRVQEAPDATPEGETPSSLSITLYSSLVDCTVPGDRIVVTGVYRAMPVRVSGNSAICKSVFKTFLEASHVKKTTKGRNMDGKDGDANSFCSIYDCEPGEIENRESHLEPAEQDIIDRIHVASKHPDLYNVFVRSIAPSIYGQEDVKLGVLCQLFGGTGKKFTMCSTRSEINILLCGDPGVAKSQILSHVNSISSRGIYTSGKGSSSVGLTAFLVKDADTGEFVLESGALVLSDRGICCIDEFDKMDDSTRSVLHEVMEQQTVSIAKAGIICTLNARSSILAAANPKDSTWNKDYNILKNLDISSTLLSRFDLIYLLLDNKDTALDRKLALHICQMYTAPPADKAPNRSQSTLSRNDSSVAGTQAPQESGFGQPMVTGEKGQESMSISDLSKYVAYAKAKVKPVLTKDAGSMLVKAYVAMRKQRGSRNVVTATTRQLEAMIRMAEAHAKIRLSPEVSEADVQAAKRLIETALRESCTDPETGMLISAGGDTHTGITTHTIIKSMQDLSAQYKWSGKSISLDEIRNKIIDLLGRAISTGDLTDAIAVLVTRGTCEPIMDGALPFK